MSTGPRTDQAYDLQRFLDEARSAGSEATPRDDSFHPPVGDHPFWTETALYSFYVPERLLQGWVYSAFRPNIGRCASAVYVWDDSGHTVDEALYATVRWYLPMPEHDLPDAELANGVRYRLIEPLKRYAVQFADTELKLDIEFDAIHAPEMLSMRGMGHIDQIGRVTGELELRGESIAIDCLAVRDRTWSIRNETGSLRGHYDVVIASPDDLMLTNGANSHEAIDGGYLVRDGIKAPIVTGTREVRRSGVRPQELTLTVTDDQGRTAIAQGSVQNGLETLIAERFFTTASLIKWSLDGASAWGEDHDSWSLDQLRAARLTK